MSGILVSVSVSVLILVSVSVLVCPCWHRCLCPCWCVIVSVLVCLLHVWKGIAEDFEEEEEEEEEEELPVDENSSQEGDEQDVLEDDFFFEQAQPSQLHAYNERKEKAKMAGHAVGKVVEYGASSAGVPGAGFIGAGVGKVVETVGKGSKPKSPAQTGGPAMGGHRVSVHNICLSLFPLDLFARITPTETMRGVQKNTILEFSLRLLLLFCLALGLRHSSVATSTGTNLLPEGRHGEGKGCGRCQEARTCCGWRCCGDRCCHRPEGRDPRGWKRRWVLGWEGHRSHSQEGHQHGQSSSTKACTTTTTTSSCS